MRKLTPAPRLPPLYPGAQDGNASRQKFLQNKKALLRIIDGPSAPLFNLVGAYLEPPYNAHVAKNTMRGVLHTVTTAVKATDEQLSNVTARYALDLLTKLNSPLPRKGQRPSSAADRSTQHLEFIVTLYLLRNMPGGLDGAHHPVPVRADGPCSAAVIHASCLLEVALCGRRVLSLTRRRIVACPRCLAAGGSGDGGAAGGSAAGSDDAPSWPEGVPREVDITVAGRLADVREVLISCAEGSSTDGSRLAHCRHENCIGPTFGSWPYVVVVPSGKPLPSSHSMRDAAGAGKRTCHRRLEYVTTQEATTYGNSAEFPYLPTAADIAQRKAGKKAARNAR